MCICEVPLEDSETWPLLTLLCWQASGCTSLHCPSQALERKDQKSLHFSAIMTGASRGGSLELPKP